MSETENFKNSKRNKYTQDECLDLKEKGNLCMSQGKYTEAIVNYSFALENFPANDLHTLYSNRSFALLKVEQYFFALQDAEKAIELAPSWPKGYFRKGEVQYQTGFYTDAIKSYNQARVRDPTDKSIAECLKKATRQQHRVNKEKARRPWLFTASSLLIAFVLIVSDHFITQLTLLQYTLIKLIILCLFGCAGYCISRLYQYTLDCQANVLLEEPPDLFGMKNQDGDHPEDGETIPNVSTQKSHKSQSSRHRHRRGR